MSSPGRARIGLVGDYNPQVLAHQAIQECFALAAAESPSAPTGEWLPTESIQPGNRQTLSHLHGIWCVPASPYRSLDGALWAIEFARTQGVPFLGTCGGYQHAWLEFARNVLGLKDAGHAESDPETSLPVVYRMKCSIIEEEQPVRVVDPGFRNLYGLDERLEGFHCSYGINPAFEPRFASSALKIVARSAEGEPRIIQLVGHPFFVGTAFQPERQALARTIHPLIRAFFQSAEQFKPSWN